MHLVIITGLSGSGKSTAAHALEDDGFFVVDNLPPALLPPFLALSTESGMEERNLAVVIDARNRDFLAGLDLHLQNLRAAGHQVEIFFFEADDETLVRRYSETRRSHPLAGGGSVADGIVAERKLLLELRGVATRLIDSTGLTPHQLRAQILRFVRSDNEAPPLQILLQSFGFRYGLPAGSDLVMDIRFLPNPHFVETLRPLSGLDPRVSGYVLNQSDAREFLQRFEVLLDFLLPQYQKEGKSYLTISIGCTGGRHRSVAVTAHLAALLRARAFDVRQIHRDIDKG
ncbi:MAG: RNase adapter RapZ [Deltaproteobacteria bacterium HGW-Deltaproteobacteria-4]|nr:MAG: RNase adapter RapZ [Deltaproteobacteria bacterium HGW-Deltaproteobacteria-4]